jgi:hypothetical protein
MDHRARELAGGAERPNGVAVAALLPAGLFLFFSTFPSFFFFSFGRFFPRRLESARALTGSLRLQGSAPRVRRNRTPYRALPHALRLLLASPPFSGLISPPPSTRDASTSPRRASALRRRPLMLARGRGAVPSAAPCSRAVAADRLGAPTAGFLSFGLSLSPACRCLFRLAAAGPYSRPGLRLRALHSSCPWGARATIISVLLSSVARRRGQLRRDHYCAFSAIGNNLGAADGPVVSGASFRPDGVPIFVIYLWPRAYGLLRSRHPRRLRGQSTREAASAGPPRTVSTGSRAGASAPNLVAGRRRHR